jgi:hypothetical protein
MCASADLQITNNYIEDFGRSSNNAPRRDPNNNTAVDDEFYGIGCMVNGGAGSVIANNKVFRFETGGREYKEGVQFVYIGVDHVRYGTGQVGTMYTPGAVIVRRFGPVTACLAPVP